jgi:phosphoenolpyruvate synthase/pyruvate phosphate dikinase
MEKIIAEGLSVSSRDSQAIGTFEYVKNVEDVINLFDNASGKICIVEDAGTTTLGPILSDLVGVICTKGSAGSHLAIVSREFNLPCVMNARFKIQDLSSLKGKKGKITTEEEDKGIVYLVR